MAIKSHCQTIPGINHCLEKRATLNTNWRSDREMKLVATRLHWHIVSWIAPLTQSKRMFKCGICEIKNYHFNLTSRAHFTKLSRRDPCNRIDTCDAHTVASKKSKTAQTIKELKNVTLARSPDQNRDLRPNTTTNNVGIYVIDDRNIKRA